VKSNYSESLRELAGLARKPSKALVRRRKAKEKWEVRTERLGGATGRSNIEGKAVRVTASDIGG
jgi:hypothetical protein